MEPLCLKHGFWFLTWCWKSFFYKRLAWSSRHSDAPWHFGSSHWGHYDISLYWRRGPSVMKQQTLIEAFIVTLTFLVWRFSSWKIKKSILLHWTPKHTHTHKMKNSPPVWTSETKSRTVNRVHIMVSESGSKVTWYSSQGCSSCFTLSHLHLSSKLTHTGNDSHIVGAFCLWCNNVCLSFVIVETIILRSKILKWDF